MLLLLVGYHVSPSVQRTFSTTRSGFDDMGSAPVTVSNCPCTLGLWKCLAACPCSNQSPALVLVPPATVLHDWQRCLGLKRRWVHCCSAFCQSVYRSRSAPASTSTKVRFCRRLCVCSRICVKSTITKSKHVNRGGLFVTSAGGRLIKDGIITLSGTDFSRDIMDQVCSTKTPWPWAPAVSCQLSSAVRYLIHVTRCTQNVPPGCGRRPANAGLSGRPGHRVFGPGGWLASVLPRRRVTAGELCTVICDMSNL